MITSLNELAIATEQNLWEIKLAHCPKSFWYPYSTLHNVAVLEKLCAAADLICWSSAKVNVEKSQTSELPTETSPFSRDRACLWT
jgi:hypothetical protein